MQKNLQRASILLFACALPLCLASKTYSQERQNRAFEPRALQILQQMQAAYGALPLLDQRTEFTFAQVPFVPGESPFAAPERPGEGQPERRQEADSKDKPKTPAAMFPASI